MKTKIFALTIVSALLFSCKKSNKTSQTSQNNPTPSTTMTTTTHVDTSIINYDVTFFISLAHPKTMNANQTAFTDYKQVQDSVKVFANGQLLTNVTYIKDNTTWASGLISIDNQINTPILQLKTGDSITVSFAHLEYTAGAFLNQAQNFIKITQICPANSSKNVYGTNKPMVVTRTGIGSGDADFGTRLH
jgi:hypothetical protein